MSFRRGSRHAHTALGVAVDQCNISCTRNGRGCGGERRPLSVESDAVFDGQSIPCDISHAGLLIRRECKNIPAGKLISGGRSKGVRQNRRSRAVGIGAVFIDRFAAAAVAVVDHGRYAQYQMQCGFLYNVILFEGTGVIQLFSRKDETHQPGVDLSLYVQLGLYTCDGIARSHVQRMGRSVQLFYKDRHADVVIGGGSHSAHRDLGGVLARGRRRFVQRSRSVIMDNVAKLHVQPGCSIECLQAGESDGRGSPDALRALSRQCQCHFTVGQVAVFRRAGCRDRRAVYRIVQDVSMQSYDRHFDTAFRSVVVVSVADYFVIYGIGTLIGRRGQIGGICAVSYFVLHGTAIRRARVNERDGRTRIDEIFDCRRRRCHRRRELRVQSKVSAVPLAIDNRGQIVLIPIRREGQRQTIIRGSHAVKRIIAYRGVFARKDDRSQIAAVGKSPISHSCHGRGNGDRRKAAIFKSIRTNLGHPCRNGKVRKCRTAFKRIRRDRRKSRTPRDFFDRTASCEHAASHIVYTVRDHHFFQFFTTLEGVVSDVLQAGG